LRSLAIQSQGLICQKNLYKYAQSAQFDPTSIAG
jgi:hypothetical protein